MLLIVPGLFLLTIWAVLAPVIVIERSDVMAAFGRSRELVRGNGWQVFGVIVVLFLLQLVVTAVIHRRSQNDVADSVVGFSVADLLVRLLVAPLSALAAAVLFFELKALRGEPVLDTGADAPAPACHPSRPRRRRRPRGPSANDWHRKRPGRGRVSTYWRYAGLIDTRLAQRRGRLRPRSAPRFPAPPRSAPRCALRWRRGSRSGSSEVPEASAFSHPSSQPHRLSRVTSAWNWSPHAGLPSMRNACTHGRRPRQLHRAGRQRRHVVVPLEQLDRRRQRPEQRDRPRPASVTSMSYQPISGSGMRYGAGAGCLGQELASKADTEDGGAALKLLPEELLFGC